MIYVDYKPPRTDDIGDFPEGLRFIVGIKRLPVEPTSRGWFFYPEKAHPHPSMKTLGDMIRLTQFSAVKASSQL